MDATSIIEEILGSEYDNSRVASAFMADHIGQSGYSEDTFRAHLEALKKDGEGYLSFVENLGSDPANAAMLSFLIVGGPDGIYRMISMLGQAGLLKKDEVKKSAKISAARTKSEKPWFKKVFEKLAASIYEDASEVYTKLRKELQEEYPELKDLETIEDYFMAVERSTIFDRVGELVHPTTKKSCAVALGFRLDVHSDARNGIAAMKKKEVVDNSEADEEAEEE